MRSINLPGALLLLAAILNATPAGMANPAPQKREYLSESESDKIREAGATGPRIVLFATFASDRIKKLRYEFAHLDPADQKRTERLNALINGYAGCIDDATDLIDIGIEKQGHPRRCEGDAGGPQGILALSEGPGHEWRGARNVQRES